MWMVFVLELYMYYLIKLMQLFRTLEAYPRGPALVSGVRKGLPKELHFRRG